MDQNLNTLNDLDDVDTSPPYAPLAMPRQILERDRREGVIGALLRLLTARNA
ncbi:hypothetical protein SAMN04488020_104227 [Palleronia marisminoris]|uniref:Uncharacterized protein n=1 Tax=Palleronia marisminoris TaxID=315423 RepID=A0A1Y5SK87_9RHOB|nr:hypothetical protein [Palleronia marisminoris]SFG86302.1 hypothetical protein SAMN04488020_104227 [Palleronia marisminoris]SLN42737.1 hypothetical protein PAM7066_01850 [Palleronia marisminoris]